MLGCKCHEEKTGQPKRVCKCYRVALTEKVTFVQRFKGKGMNHMDIWREEFADKGDGRYKGTGTDDCLAYSRSSMNISDWSWVSEGENPRRWGSCHKDWPCFNSEFSSFVKMNGLTITSTSIPFVSLKAISKVYRIPGTTFFLCSIPADIFLFPIPMI